MAWYNGTYACGCEGRENIVGPTKNRQWIADKKFEKLCAECWEKHLIEEREKANAEAAEKAKEMELPELEGTEKQVAWANTIRQEMITKIEKAIENIMLRYKDKSGKVISEITEILNYILENKTKASWFIDNRGQIGNIDTNTVVYTDILEILRTVRIEMQNAVSKSRVEEKTESEIKAEATVYPVDCQYAAPAEIKVNDSLVSVSFEKNEKFIETVKSLGYKWDGAWKKSISETTGNAVERAAELGNKLLNAGFPIMIMDENIRNNAINGKYKPECNRWVFLRTKGEFEGRLAINWAERNDKLYDRARSLPKSKWDAGSVLVKVDYYKEIQEFAELYGFRFTKKAQTAIDQFIEAQKLAQVVVPAAPKETAKQDGLKEILKSSTNILPDLVDED